jgi:periplasmic protein CpxP/Spy
MKMKRLLLATVTMVVLSGTAYGMPGPEFPGMGGPGEGILRALLRLDLTDSQKHEAALILAKYRDEGQKKIDAVREAMEALRAASEADALDEDAIRKAFKGVAAAGEELAVHGARLRAELRGMLTPEQKVTLEELKADRHERRKGRRERGASFLDEWIEMHSKVEDSR